MHYSAHPNRHRQEYFVTLWISEMSGTPIMVDTHVCSVSQADYTGSLLQYLLLCGTPNPLSGHCSMESEYLAPGIL